MNERSTIRNGQESARAAAPVGHDVMSMVAQNFRMLERNTLRGFPDVVQALGLTIRGVSVHQRDGRWWAAAPGRARVGRDGMQLPNSGGQLQFAPVFEFIDRAAQDRFSEAVLTASRSSLPSAFAALGAAAVPRDMQDTRETIEKPPAIKPHRRVRRGGRGCA